MRPAIVSHRFCQQIHYTNSLARLIVPHRAAQTIGRAYSSNLQEGERLHVAERERDAPRRGGALREALSGARGRRDDGMIYSYTPSEITTVKRILNSIDKNPIF